MLTSLLISTLLSSAPVVDAQTGLRFVTEHEGYVPCILVPAERWDPECGELPPPEKLRPGTRLLFVAAFRGDDHAVVVNVGDVRFDRPSRMSEQNVNEFIRGNSSSLKKTFGPELAVVPRANGALFDRLNLNQTVAVHWVVETPDFSTRIVNYAFPTDDAIVTVSFIGLEGSAARPGLERISKAFMGGLRPPVTSDPDFAMPRNADYELGRSVGQFVGSLLCSLFCLAMGVVAVIALYRAIRKSGQPRPPQDPNLPPPPPVP